MLQRPSIKFVGLLYLALSSAMIAQASADTPDVTPWPPHLTEFGTGAYAAQGTAQSSELMTRLITTGILSPVTPPSLSGSLATMSFIFGASGPGSASTVNSPNDSISDSSASTLNITMGVTPNTDAILISAASSQTEARCHDVYPRLHLTTSVGTVTVNGVGVVVTGAPNQVVPLPNSGGQMILNQQIKDLDHYSGRASANAVNASAAGQNVIIAHTQGFADCWDQR